MIPVDHAPHLVNISLYPHASDFKDIYEEINKINMNRCIQRLYDYLLPRLCDADFELINNLGTREKALKHIEKKLIGMQLIDSQFLQRINDREAIGSTAFYNAIALPHLSEPAVKKDFVYILISKNPVQWDSSDINVIFVIGKTKNRIREMQFPYGLFIKVFSYYRNINAILQAYSASSFLDILINLKL